MRKILVFVFVVLLFFVLVKYIAPRVLQYENIEPEEGVVEEVEETVASLYFYRADADMDEEGNVLCDESSVQPTTRSFQDYSIEQHLEELLSGPTVEDVEAGFSSEFPLDGVLLDSVYLSDQGELLIGLTDENNLTQGGSCRVGLLYSQISKTALSIEGVESVIILPETLFQP